MKRGAALALTLAAGIAGARTPVPLCVTDFPPYVSPALPDGGQLTALARRAFAAGGLGVRQLDVPWVRAYAMAGRGECLLLAVWRNEERDAQFRYSLPVAQMELGLFVRADRQAPLPHGATVAYQRGSYLPPAMAGGRYRLHALINARPGLELLQLGRVEAVFSERASFEHQLAQRPGGAWVRWQAPPLEVKPTFMALSKAHPQAQAWLALLDEEIRQSGELRN
ncbi:MAG: transporter substrate-binding domain-containing protein [Roseateles sp.]|uniref:substrate-binding periplasmic protein n=1 Tax=Roseateles sp. TaxID=1971397 RepID=UPI0039E9F055